ncbi:hypothetical protein EV643_103186 [Kribbella sp. VKM Ac-2527]|uniref:Uncharacterized protein n=1 Tax=Kribbella caucasensis TaxID=2512215 RepID=A0A4R6KPD7_9ACTN|nr:hypothetical protein EV643_103186 [Kribbella sp. VKM Ac-2527]
MDLRDRLADVRRRPNLYGLTTFGEAAAFVTGMDAATEWRFLEGFREWLAAKSELGANLVWQVLVVRIAYPDEANDYWVAASHGESSEAVAVLFDELHSFLTDRETRNTE